MRSASGAARSALVALAMLATLAGCDDLINGASRGYTGPQPAQEALAGETALVAQVRTGAPGQVVLILDRLRFVEAGRPHDVNRVVKVWTTAANQAEVGALGLGAGDRVTVSTAFVRIDEGGGAMGVDDWPGHDAMEYPIGAHQITAIARVSP